MKGARGLASGMLVLAAVCAVPAISAAQEAGTTTEGTTTTTTPPPPPAPPPSDPGTPAGTGEPKQPDAPSTGPASGTPHEAEDSGEPTTDLRRAASAGGPRGGARKATSASVSVGDNFYSPASVSVDLGDTVTWRNNGQAQHSATADDGTFDTGVFGAGASRSHTFTRTGTFSYYCTVHGQAQSGTVRVLAASGGGSGGGGGGSGGSSASATGDSEEAAVSSPGAAGDANTLPATGMAAGGLALVGLVLLAFGLFTHGAVRRWFSPL